MKLESVWGTVVSHLPAAHRGRIVEILAKIHETLAQFFRGRLILLALRFVLLLVVFLVFGVPFSTACAVFGAVASFVPVLGSVVAIAVPLALHVANGAGGGELLFLLSILVVIEVVEQYLLTPAVVGRRLGLHPLTILVSTFIAGELLGIFGMLVAIPLTAVLKVLFVEFVLPEIRRQAGMPAEDGAGDGATAAGTPASGAPASGVAPGTGGGGSALVAGPGNSSPDGPSA